MRLTSVVLTSWISSITSKISWIVGWPWSNHVCICVWVCLCVCLSVYNLIHGRQKQILGFFLSGNLDFGLEMSWKNHGTFFWDFCGNPVDEIDFNLYVNTYIYVNSFITCRWSAGYVNAMSPSCCLVKRNWWHTSGSGDWRLMNRK